MTLAPCKPASTSTAGKARTAAATMPAFMPRSAMARSMSSTICSASPFKGGEDKFDAYSLGGYWTHFGPSDWYLDGVLQATWYDASMTGGRGLRDGETDGWGLAASIEGGYPFHFGNGWLIEPQAQLVYQTIDLADFNDGFADVRYSDEDSLAGRIGARLARTWDLEEPQGDGPGTGSPPEPVRQASLWLRGDIWHEFIAQPTTEFSSATGFVPFTADGLEDSCVEARPRRHLGLRHPVHALRQRQLRAELRG